VSRPINVDRAPPSPKRDRPADIGPPLPALSLDQAIERLTSENLDLRAMRAEIPMARADVESAGYQPGPYLLVRISKEGFVIDRVQPRQIVPKRWIRILKARLGERIREAQYQNAVRLKIADLYTAFVDVQEAHLSVDITRLNRDGMDRLTDVVNLLVRTEQLDTNALSVWTSHHNAASLEFGRRETELRKAELTLANLLNLPDADTDRLDAGGRVDVIGANPPSVEELIRIGLRHRPDLEAYRRGLLYADAELVRVWVEQLADVTVFDRPDRSGQPKLPGPGRAIDRDLELLVSVPILNPNRGVIDRAAINVEQTRTELAAVERRVVVEIRQARLDFEQSRAEVQTYRDQNLPKARQARDDAFEHFQQGESSVQAYLEAQQQYNELVYRYREATVRHRRDTLALNTAVGHAIAPSSKAR
jgi:cobalt-zinc-cadmium efflux system outer membrane protein